MTILTLANPSVINITLNNNKIVPQFVVDSRFSCIDGNVTIEDKDYVCLFHGTTREVARQVLKNPIPKAAHNGIGFYTSKNVSEAKRWSAKKVGSPATIGFLLAKETVVNNTPLTINGEIRLDLPQPDEVIIHDMKRFLDEVVAVIVLI